MNMRIVLSVGVVVAVSVVAARGSIGAASDPARVAVAARAGADSPAQCGAPRPVTPPGEGFFTDISDASGIRDENYDPNPPATMKINDHSRLAFGDVDGDGFDDAVMHNLFPNPRDGGIPFEHLVFRNRGDGTFENVSDASGLRDVQAGFFLFGDVDNDGDQDVFAGLDVPLPRSDNAHRILVNDGEGHFTEQPNAGVNVPFQDQNGNIIHYAGNAVFADFDADADLDLFVGNGQTSAGVPDQVFVNRGDGTFAYDATRLRGATIARASNGSVTCDYDRDGDQDIFVSVYGVSLELGQDVLWENDGRGFFTNVARERGFEALATGNYFLAATGHGRTSEPGKGPGQYVGGNGFGLQCEDMTNDGWPDVFVTNISHPVPADYARTWSDPSALLVNQGPDAGFRFENVWLDRGLPFNEGDVDGGAADFDNDGFLDLSISRDRKYEPSYTTLDQLAWFGLMRQRADGTFASLGPASGINDTAHDPPELLRMKAAQNHVWSDIEHDGDLDLLVGGRSGGIAGRPNFLFRNDIGSQNDWLAVRLVGDGVHVNRDAIGARVELVFSDEVLMREVKSSRGMYNSMDTRTLHFGLGARGCDYTLRVTWPDGTVRSLAGDAAGRNRRLTLRYGEGEQPTPEDTPTQTAGTPTASSTPTDDPTPTPPGTLTMTGLVFDAILGVGAPIPGAVVTARPACLPRQPFQATTGPDGRYQLLVPEPYVFACADIDIGAHADGFEAVQAMVPVADLLMRPERDFALAPAGGTATPTATITPTRVPDITMTGRVTDAATGLPIAGAVVAIRVCVPHQPFQATSGADGRYSVLLPGIYAEACESVQLEVRAAGYVDFEVAARVADLRADPVRDFALESRRSVVYLPVLRRGATE